MASSDSPSIRSALTSSISGSSSEHSSNFLDEEDDPLIPHPKDVHRTYCEGKATWEAFLRQAETIPHGLWPVDALNPHVTLVDVPSLPERLPRSNCLSGRPLWELPQNILGVVSQKYDPQNKNNITLAHGRRISVQLSTEAPIWCEIGPDAASCAFSSLETIGSHVVLVMCWSYILSVRFLEMQGRDVRYTQNRLWPKVREDQREAAVDIDLEGASPSLIRWLCAILSPQMGWQAADRKALPPWATTFTGETKLIIEASDPAVDTYSPPNSSEATELLIELCLLFDFGNDASGASGFEPITPYKASFLATLVIPFYSFMKLQPRLPRPHLAALQRNGTFSTYHKQCIRGYMDNIRYFMTLSAYPLSIGSMVWSIFWQPDICCNLVGAWLASMADTLEPTIEQHQIEVLLKVFLLRRPRIGIWWVALFLLGDRAILGWIRRYAARLEEKYGFGSLSAPDSMMSAWNGSKQSFTDLGNDSVYLKPSDLVSRADLLRCRFDVKLQDWASTTLSWRPFGYVQKGEVEPELWPQLESKYTRRYNSFTWYVGKQTISDMGFRRQTGQHVRNVPDNLEIRAPTKYLDNIFIGNTRPSKQSTCRMMFFSVEDAAGGRDWGNAGLPVEREKLRWLREWQGLDSMERAVDNTEKPMKEPTWFLKEWMNK